VKRKSLLFIISILFVILIGCSKQQDGATIGQPGKDSVIEDFTIASNEGVVESSTVVAKESVIEATIVSVTEVATEVGVATSNVIATEPSEVIAIEAVVEVALTEAAEVSPIVAPQAPAETGGLTFGYYTNCTKVGLNQHKAEYGKHLPYEYFSFGSDSAVYCIAYEDDALSYGLKPKFNSLLGLTATMQEFSNYGKAKGGNGVVGAILLDFGNYNGKRLCVVSVGTN